MNPITFWLVAKPRWWAYLAWRGIGRRVFGMPHMLEFNDQQRVMAIMFSASLEEMQKIKTLYENYNHYVGLEHELEAAHAQIVELEGGIKDPEVKA